MILALTLAFAGTWSADNLLANSGFEEAVNGRPAAWDIYLLDPERSLARIDETAYAGEHSVLLQNALPYDNEPYNNWSQNILQPLAGKRLRAEASIRTEAAGGAGIWVQCWRKKPLKVLHLADSSQATPVSGTSAWQQVSLYFTAPQETDFVTVRCVLTGSGTAWFDDVRLEIPPAETTSKIVEPLESRRESTTRTGRSEAIRPEMPVAPVPPTPPSRPDPLQSPTAPRATAQQAEALLQAEALKAVVDAMQKSNSAMMEELESLRGELQQLRGELPQQPLDVPPMLVPREENQ